ncbi:MAG: hypothetical protein HY536_00260 [Candidatus Colwellbacteria bacterium]|nr:hypothetical protein [Candidatus Colwellbacteria bacterium]
MRLASKAAAIAFFAALAPAYLALPAVSLIFFTPPIFGWGFGGYFTLIAAEAIILSSSVSPYILVPAAGILFFILLGFRECALVRDERLYLVVEVAALAGLGLALGERLGYAPVTAAAVVVWWLTRARLVRRHGAGGRGARVAAGAVAFVAAELLWFISLIGAAPLARAALLAVFVTLISRLADDFAEERLAAKKVFAVCVAAALPLLVLIAYPLLARG